MESDYVSNGIPFWGAKDMLNNELVYSNQLRFISKHKFDSLSQGKLKHNDFVCLLRGAVGKWAIFKENDQYKTGFINAQMVIIRLQENNLVEWVMTYLCSPLFEKQCQIHTSGTAVAQMSAKDLSEFLIPIPTSREQEEIITIVNILLKKIKGED